MAKHKAVPPPSKRSVLGRNGSHTSYTKGWVSGKSPWYCAAHHILPVSCFSLKNIKCKPASKKYYIRRCLWVSEYNVNGGAKFKKKQKAKGKNNMVRLPTKSGYTKTYPTRRRTTYKTEHPVNECMHSGTWSEHYLYNKEAYQWLTDYVWKKLQENKEKHGKKGKSILAALHLGEEHFRKQLVNRGKRNGGTEDCWEDKNKRNRTRPFSMAASTGPNKTRNPV